MKQSYIININEAELLILIVISALKMFVLGQNPVNQLWGLFQDRQHELLHTTHTLQHLNYIR